uniref:WW domain-containing protein n=1 Tax=Eptatretus burgeri TaxID=7764 RepID=A0A8C4QAI4_EPTBU
MVQDTTMQEKPVPEGWKKWQCRSSGYFYYFNPLTNHWQWQHSGQETARAIIVGNCEKLPCLQCTRSHQPTHQDTASDANGPAIVTCAVKSKVRNDWFLCCTSKAKDAIVDWSRLLMIGVSSTVLKGLCHFT